MSEWEEYVYCDGELFPIQDMIAYGTVTENYGFRKTYDGRIIEKRLLDSWENPREEIIGWEAPNGCVIEEPEIPEEYIVLIREENGKVIANIPGYLLDIGDNVIYEAKSIEDVAEFIRHVQETEDGYDYLKSLLRTVPASKYEDGGEKNG